ncbi:PepSY-associated TM helix domain-containing protein [Vibrio parahaemolyticus]|nr:PepSY-associated TM helix domain-containing protein [Vibrio parahaemolyticus]ELA7518114.1 PepSY-associated TM helix domain-containing protein [Vibrio parahaemolyticus]ELC0679769.1 PepSY-associated TM helix domain-containing protein [Vibrio parahaemolyticus]
MLLKSKGVQTWARRLHIYISMALLLVTLFFAFTGITLNRPELFERKEPIIQQHTIIIPPQTLFLNGESFQPNRVALIDFLTQEVALRGTPSALDVYTEVEQGELVLGELSLDFKGPGYNATVFVDMTTGDADIETTNYGAIALLNDLHKGRNSGDIWKWFIDITALLMVFFVLTGVCLLLPKKKTFRTSLQWMSFGSLLSLVIYFVAVP